MYRKIVLALILVMHYSLAFGAIEAAAMPDELHPFGKNVPHSHLHQHSHDPHHDFDVSQKHGHGHAAEHNNAAHQSAHQDNSDNFHDHQHKHSINFQLNVDIPVLLALDFFKPDTPSVTPYQLHHRTLSYAPAVPPPDSL
ncbi:MAG: hypothetical protein Q8S94_09570 [Pseudohongiella sp.]|nr:hypothetical protein [Pseudohongiella sp.]